MHGNGDEVEDKGKRRPGRRPAEWEKEVLCSPRRCEEVSGQNPPSSSQQTEGKETGQR